jgi:hypothetical protein
MTATFTIDANAALGARTVTLTIPGGATAAATFTVADTLPTIGSFTATPEEIFTGGSSVLRWTGVTNATSCSINNGVGTVSCADGSVTVSPASTTEYQFLAIGAGGREWMYALVRAGGGTQTFDFTGGAQTFVVPDGVTRITIDASGAAGGRGNLLATGGAGGRVTATIPVTAGETLTIRVGGSGGDGGVTGGAGGFNGGGAGSAAGGNSGGGGGGASDVSRGATLLVIAGAGGGGFGRAFASPSGGNGGGTTGAAGVSSGGGGGGGGTQAAGGAGGAIGGANGSAGTGGAAAGDGGGGGAGLFGGGGGGASAVLSPGGGGGGGSSFAAAGATNVAHTQGARSGNGQVSITW